MTPRLKRFVVPFALLVCLLVSSGCNSNGVATINYTQVGACNGWNDGSELHTAGPNAAYVVFKVQSIDNTSGKVDFAFEPSKMAVNVSSRPHMDSGLTLAKFMGVFQLVPKTIPLGKVVGLDGFSVAVVPTSNPNGSVEANQTAYTLVYDTSTKDPGILFAKGNLGKTSWPNTEDCTTIKY